METLKTRWLADIPGVWRPPMRWLRDRGFAVWLVRNDKRMRLPRVRGELTRTLPPAALPAVEVRDIRPGDELLVSVYSWTWPVERRRLRVLNVSPNALLFEVRT